MEDEGRGKAESHSSLLRSPNTSQQLGKYISNGLEMLPLSDMRIVVDRPGFFDSHDANETKDECIPKPEEAATGARKDDCVCLSNLYDTYSKLSERIDMFVRRDYFDKTFMKHILKELCNGEYERAKDLIYKELKDRDPFFSWELHHGVGWKDIKKDVSASLCAMGEARDEVRDIAEMVVKLRRTFFEMRSRNFDMELDYTRINSDLVKQLSACSKEMEALKRSRDMIVKDIKEIGLGIDIEDKENGINMLTLKNGVKDLRHRMEIMEMENKELRMRTENAIPNETFNRKPGTKRSVTVEKQKGVIEAPQIKMFRECELPMDELREKIEEIRKRIVAEKDQDEKRRLMEDVADYERRMADFLSIAGGNTK